MLLRNKYSSCCSCAKCTCGTKLPDTVTLDIQGRYGPKEKIYFADVQVASNFGCGASIRVINPGGCDTDARPLTRQDIEIVNGGKGYAVLGRKQPAVFARIAWSPFDDELYSELCPEYQINVTVAQGNDGGKPFWYLSDATGPGDCVFDPTSAGPVVTFEEGTVVCWEPSVQLCNPTTVTAKGYFYLPDPDPDAIIVADVELLLTVRSPGIGSDCTITPVIDQDPESPTFGQIIDVTVSCSGDHLLWKWDFPCDCGDRTVVLPQSPADICLYRKCFCTDAPGPWLVNLTFEACHGAGATAHASEPIGIPGIDEGPITKITVDNGGSGYALLGRVAPTVDGFRCDSGAEATITTTLASLTGQCDHSVWQVDAVAVTAGGYNYSDGESVTFTTSDGTVEADGHGRVAATTTAAPTLTIEPVNGVDFSVSIASNGDFPQTWGVDLVAASEAGTGFVDNQQLEVKHGDHETTFAAADVRVRTVRSEPTVSATIVSESGSGGTAAATLQKFSGVAGRDAWRVSSVTVRAGGAGYSVDDAVEFSLDGEQAFTVEQPAARVSTVSEEGEITAIDVSTPGQMFNDTGVLDEISVPSAGSYALAGIIESIEVIDGGRYYKTDPAQPALTSPITVTLRQTWPSEGTGAVLKAVVDTKTDSPTFGQITDVTISEAGDHYLAASTLTDNCYEVRYPGPPIDKINDNQESPTYGQKVKYQPQPSVRVIRGTCDFTRYGKDFVAKCDEFTFEVEPDDPCDTESKMTVTPGGNLVPYDPQNPCCGCCCEGGEAQTNPHKGELQCGDEGGTYYKNVKCDAVNCADDGACCVVVDGVVEKQSLTADQCKAKGGKVLTAQHVGSGCGQCDCTVDCAYDLSECEGYVGLTVAYGCLPAAGPCADGLDLFSIWKTGQSGMLARVGDPGERFFRKWLLFVRKDNKVNWSTHCDQQLIVVGKGDRSHFLDGDFYTDGYVKYMFVNCVTNEVEIHDMEDFWTLHDGWNNNAGDFGLCSNDADNSDASAAPCESVTLACAP